VTASAPEPEPEPELELEPEPEPQSVHQTEPEVQLQPIDSGGFLHVSSMDESADDFVTSKEEDELAAEHATEETAAQAVVTATGGGDWLHELTVRVLLFSCVCIGRASPSDGRLCVTPVPVNSQSPICTTLSNPCTLSVQPEPMRFGLRADWVYPHIPSGLALHASCEWVAPYGRHRSTPWKLRSVSPAAVTARCRVRHPRLPLAAAAG
jgi:hypothetical protein